MNECNSTLNIKDESNENANDDEEESNSKTYNDKDKERWTYKLLTGSDFSQNMQDVSKTLH